MGDAVIIPTNTQMCYKKFAVMNEFCNESGMIINEEKTKGFVINGRDCDKQCLTSTGVSVSYASQYLYLGARLADSAAVNTVMALHQTPAETTVNKCSIFCASNTTLPFILKRAVLTPQ